MEGVLCSQNGCNCRDFLPFTCKLCYQQYCLDHRSRFVHDCISILESLNNTNEEEFQSLDKNENSVSFMMKSVERRFENETELNQNDKTNSKVHNHMKQSSKQLSNNANNKNIDKLMKLKDLATSRKQYNIINKTRQMIIKTKALGNQNIVVEDRFYMIIHFINQLNSLSPINTNENDTQDLYIYMSKHKTNGELLYYLWQNYAHVITSKDCFKDSNDVASLSHKDISLVMTTEDTPDWHDWDRNKILKDCFHNFEDISIYALPSQLVIDNQNKLFSKLINNVDNIQHNSNDNNPVVSNKASIFQPSIYEKHQLAWYHKIPSEVVCTLDVLNNMETIEQTQPMIIVEIVDVHKDDFPNMYYTIRIKHPIQITTPTSTLTTTTIVSSSSSSSEQQQQQLPMNYLIFEQEKQTDAYHLLPLSITTTKSIEEKHSLKSNTNPMDLALKSLQDTLCSMGIPINMKINYSNKQYDIMLGNICTISQLKLLISATLNIPVPNMQLITKGLILKNNHQKISDTKLINGSKITVMCQNNMK